MKPSLTLTPVPYHIKCVNGELPPWRLRPRVIPMPESSKVVIKTLKFCDSAVRAEEWTDFLTQGHVNTLPAESSHTVELQADVHSTAFLRWVFRGVKGSSEIKLRVTYSEGYELEPRSYPYFRSKADRLDASKGVIIGPYDEVVLAIPDTKDVIYEPFWFRTFRVVRVEITIGSEPVELVRLDGTQVNYPLAVKASWENPEDPSSKEIWDVSIRTLRNCMFDGYSDCPFYEQLQ